MQAEVSTKAWRTLCHRSPLYPAGGTIPHYENPLAVPIIIGMLSVPFPAIIPALNKLCVTLCKTLCNSVLKEKSATTDSIPYCKNTDLPEIQNFIWKLLKMSYTENHRATCGCFTEFHRVSSLNSASPFLVLRLFHSVTPSLLGEGAGFADRSPSAGLGVRQKKNEP